MGEAEFWILAFINCHIFKWDTKYASHMDIGESETMSAIAAIDH